MDCCHKECSMPPRWKLGVQLWAVGHRRLPNTAAHMFTPLVICDHHRKQPGLASEFFGTEARAEIVAAFQAIGKAVPDFDGAEWEFSPLENAPMVQ